MNTHDKYISSVKEIMSEYPDSKMCIRACEAKLEDVDDERRLLYYYAIVLSYLSTARFEKSFEVLIDMLKLAINVSNHFFVVYAYNLMGVMYTHLKIHCNALEAYVMAFEMAIYYDIDGVMSMIYNNIGEVMTDLGDHEVAAQYYEKSYQPFMNKDITQTPPGFHPAYIANLARAYFYLGRFDEGRELLEKLDYLEAEEAYMYRVEAEVAYLNKMGDLDGIMTIFERSLVDIDKRNDKILLINLALTCCKIFNDNEININHLYDYLVIARREANNHQLFDACAKFEKWLGNIHMDCAEVEKALDAYQRYTEFVEKDISFKKRVLLLAMHLRVDMSAHHHDLVLIEEKEMAISKAKQLIVQTSDQIELIKSIGLKMATLVDYRELSISIYSQLKRLMSVDYFYILLKDEDIRAAMPCVLVAEGEMIDSIDVDLNDPASLVKRRFEDSSLYYCAEMTRNQKEGYLLSRPNKAAEANSAESVVIMPLIRDGEIIGVYSVQSKLCNAYDKEQLAIIEKLAPFITIAAENAILDTKIEKRRKLSQDLQFQIDNLNNRIMLESKLDGLTRVYNKDYFFANCQRFLHESKSKQCLFALYVINIDDFAAYNDYYGIAAGDRVLTALAGELSEYFKAENSMLARYGGGLFINGMIAESVGDLVVKGQHLVDRVKALNIENEKSPHGVITVSVGLVYDTDNTSCCGDLVFSCAECLMREASLFGGCQLFHSKFLQCEQKELGLI